MSLVWKYGRGESARLKADRLACLRLLESA